MPCIQYASTSNDNWGIGFLAPKSLNIIPHKINFPIKHALKVYTIDKSPLSLKYKNNSSLLLLQPGSNKPYKLLEPISGEPVDFIELSYEGTCLIVYEIINDTYHILTKSFPGGVYISKNDLLKYGYSYISYYDYIIKSKNEYIVFIKEGLNLREKPSIDSNIITIINSDSFTIIPSNTTFRQWIYVDIIKYDKHPCEGGKRITKLRGWIKLIDDKGFPNIWYYTRGC